MFKRQSLLAVGSARPLCAPAARVCLVRCKSDVQSGNRQKGSNTKPNNPSPERTSPPANAPNTGRTRQQRAAQVSEEVRMLNRGSPRGAPSPYPSTQSRQIDADAVVSGSPAGQMGNNTSAEREGPNAQGTGRVIRAGKASDQVRSERSPRGALQEPTTEQQQQLSGSDRLEQEASFAAEQDEVEDGGMSAPSTQHELILLEQFDKQDITPVAFEHEPVTAEEFLQQGMGGATIAAGNFEGVIEDRLRLLAESTQDGFRHAPHIASRMLDGGFVSFKDEQEKAAVLAVVEKHTRTRPGAAFSPVPQAGQTALFDKLVRGSYTHPNSSQHKQSLLNDVMRNTSRNSTYLAEDQSKLLKKIRSLLPSEAAARKAAPKPRK